ncbi:hypothetical protein SAT01_26120 [Sinomonas atrocyanea]|uniref:hypothetical protein n=1 Tax=Sinomonas atrocyanea TaxID=37927 RepID=UPI001141A274|nr:hypothetical protein [Sinomonas atrocyanea]GEB65164.1 hypothetical protein SAT01_26120 [Sinomonas atrocyanea]GGG58507.1 hypothetical protein GCM10007172_06710 [Sinomonas atrocyanea]
MSNRPPGWGPPQPPGWPPQPPQQPGWPPEPPLYPPPRRGGGSLVGGLFAGIGALALLFGLSVALASIRWVPGFIGVLLFLGYVAGAIVLTVRPATMRFGAGLLIAIGAWILIGAGLCVAALFVMPALIG